MPRSATLDSGAEDGVAVVRAVGGSARATQTRCPGWRPSSAALPRLSWTQQDSSSARSTSTLTSKPRWVTRATVPSTAAGARLAFGDRVHDEVVRAHPLAVEAGRRAEEGQHELVGRVVVHVRRRAHLLEAAVVDDGQAVGHLHGLLLVVGDQHRGHGQRGVQVAQPQAQLRAHLRVERAEGLVEQQHLGLDGERAGEGHALALATRELGGVALAEVGQADQLEQLVDARLDLGLGAVADLEPEGHVAPHRQVAERRVVLEAEADAAAARRRVRSGPRPRCARCRCRPCRGRR